MVKVVHQLAGLIKISLKFRFEAVEKFFLPLGELFRKFLTRTGLGLFKLRLPLREKLFNSSRPPAIAVFSGATNFLLHLPGGLQNGFPGLSFQFFSQFPEKGVVRYARIVRGMEFG